MILRRHTKAGCSVKPLFDDLTTPPSGRLPNEYRPVIIDGVRLFTRTDVYNEIMKKCRKENRKVVELGGPNETM